MEIDGPDSRRRDRLSSGDCRLCLTRGEEPGVVGDDGRATPAVHSHAANAGAVDEIAYEAISKLRVITQARDANPQATLARMHNFVPERGALFGHDVDGF